MKLITILSYLFLLSGAATAQEQNHAEKLALLKEVSTFPTIGSEVSQLNNLPDPELNTAFTFLCDNVQTLPAPIKPVARKPKPSRKQKPIQTKTYLKITLQIPATENVSLLSCSTHSKVSF